MNASMLNGVDNIQLRELADVIITNKDIARGTTKFLENDTSIPFPSELRDFDSVLGRPIAVGIENMKKPTSIYYELFTGQMNGKTNWKPNSVNERNFYIGIIMAAQKAIDERESLFPSGHGGRKSRRNRRSKSRRNNRKSRRNN